MRRRGGFGRGLGPAPAGDGPFPLTLCVRLLRWSPSSPRLVPLSASVAFLAREGMPFKRSFLLTAFEWHSEKASHPSTLARKKRRWPPKSGPCLCLRRWPSKSGLCLWLCRWRPIPRPVSLRSRSPLAVSVASAPKARAFVGRFPCKRKDAIQAVVSTYSV
jgi:hypothetical protein